MIVSEEQIVELAQQYLSKLQKANEIEFATFKPGALEDYYEFLDGLDSKCSHLADCFRIGCQNKEVEAELESALNVANIKVDRESNEYKLLISKFLFAATEACFQRLSMYKGDFEYKDVPNFSIYGNTNYVAQYINTEFPPIKKRAETTAIQKEVNKLAKEIMDKYPRTSKYDLANEIADKLVKEQKFQKKPKFEAIRKKYLTKYPNF